MRERERERENIYRKMKTQRGQKKRGNENGE